MSLTGHFYKRLEWYDNTGWYLYSTSTVVNVYRFLFCSASQEYQWHITLWTPCCRIAGHPSPRTDTRTASSRYAPKMQRANHPPSDNTLRHWRRSHACAPTLSGKTRPSLPPLRRLARETSSGVVRGTFEENETACRLWSQTKELGYKLVGGPQFYMGYGTGSTTEVLFSPPQPGLWSHPTVPLERHQKEHLLQPTRLRLTQRAMCAAPTLPSVYFARFVAYSGSNGYFALQVKLAVLLPYSHANELAT